MSQSFYGSIDFTKLIELAKQKNKAFHRSDVNGKIYVDVQVFIKDEPDKYGNNLSIRTSYKGATTEDKVYFGNLKKSENNQSEVTPTDIPDTFDF